MGRAPCCDKTKVKRGPWSPEEDDTLKDYVHKYGTGGNWIALPHKAGLKRCGKSCRLRWLNYLRPDIKRGGFTEEEDNVILTLYTNIGSRWSVIASKLPGRTDNDVKNHWNTKLKKKLLARTTEPRIKNVPFMDSNNFALNNNNMDFYSTTSLATFNAVQANCHENFSTYSVMHSNTVPHSVEVIQGYPVPDMLYESSMDQLPLPSLTEVQENDTPYDGLITTSSSREISSLSPSYSLAKSYASSWTENEVGEKMGFFEEFESRSSNYGHHHQNTQQEETVISSIEFDDDHLGLLGDYAYPMGSLLANISGNAPSQSIS